LFEGLFDLLALLNLKLQYAPVFIGLGGIFSHNNPKW
jgi:hypothetical protein